MRQFTLVVVLVLAAVLSTGSCSQEQDEGSWEAREDSSEEQRDESDEAGTGRNALLTTAKESKSSSSINTVKSTKVNVKSLPVVERVVEKVKPIVNKMVQPIVQKVVKQPLIQKIYQKPAVQQIYQRPAVQQQVVHQPVMQQVAQPALQPQQFVHHQMGVPQNHIDVLPMSSGMYAVAVDNMMGSHINYLGLNSQIRLMPQEVQGVNQYVFPAQDMVSHQQSLVHLGSPNGHLVLSNLNIGGQAMHGFQGWDNQGQVIVPVHGQGAQMYVEPTAHRVSSFASAGRNTFSFARA